MRVIKFRAWDIENKQMDSWDEIQEMWETEGYRPNGVLGFDHWIPMQFTGKIDVNGKEVYEGDICKGKRSYAETHIVTWDEKRSSFYLQPIDGIKKASYDKGYKMNSGKIEVIGNIHESNY